MNKCYKVLNKVILFALIILPCFTLTACHSSNQEHQNNNPLTVWFSNPKEYRTTDLSVAQAETPFTIVLPTYLPEDIKTPPVIGGRARSEFDNYEPVTITYQGKSNRSIYIYEYNHTVDVFYADNPKYLMYHDIQVIEMEDTALTFNDAGDTIFVPTLCYYWNRNDVKFNVIIYIYEHNEARKIIESMIE